MRFPNAITAAHKGKYKLVSQNTRWFLSRKINSCCVMHFPIYTMNINVLFIGDHFVVVVATTRFYLSFLDIGCNQGNLYTGGRCTTACAVVYQLFDKLF